MPKPTNRTASYSTARLLSAPSEDSEQALLASVLDLCPGLLWAAVPNGGKRSKSEGIKFKRTGVKRGVPDCFVYTPPPALPHAKGVAFEMKRENGVPSDVEPEQILWLDRLQQLGWVTFVAFGAKDALRQLKCLGYQLVVLDSFLA